MSFGRIRGFFGSIYRSGTPLERVCRALVCLISLGFALAAFWELNAPFGAGHFASAAAVCAAAENMWRWGTAAVATRYSLTPPLPSDYYCHHPWGIFWVSVPFVKLFGHHEWACRLPAALESAFTPAVLYAGARRIYGPVAGVAAAAAFAVTPIALSFADFNSLEVPVIFGTAVAIWGYARFRAEYRRRDAALALAGLGYAVCCDWAGVFFAAAFLGSVFVSSFVLRRWVSRVDHRRVATFWGLALALCALIVGAHLAYFQSVGQINELISQGNLRSAGSQLPLSLVLHARKFWIEVSFTSLGIGLGKLALPLIALRALLRRSDVEALPLAVFAMALAQYVAFKQGADIHIFWPHYFAEYLAFACAALVFTLQQLAERTWLWLRGSGSVWPGYAALGIGLIVPGVILPDGLRALSYAHRTGGRFNENGHLTKPDRDKAAALAWLSERMATGTSVLLHPGMKQSLWVEWALRRPARTVTALPQSPQWGPERYYIADLRFMSPAEQESLVHGFAASALGPFLAVDRAHGPAPLQAFSLVPHEPSAFQAYFTSSSHALYRVEPDPYATWEMRDRFALTPNEVPHAAPLGFEQLRIAHNIAWSQGDVATAKKWLDALLVDSDHSVNNHFSDGSELLAARLERGSSLIFSLYFLAGPTDESEPEFAMHSLLLGAPPGSLVDKDLALQDVGMPFEIPSSRWKPGYVYASRTSVLRRLGRERWTGAFRSTKPATTRVSSAELTVLTLD